MKENKRGFFVVITLDRFDELKRFLISLSKFHKDYPICIYVAKDSIDSFRIKTKAAFLTPFEYNVVIDIDIFVNGRLHYLFEVAEKGKIGVVRHPRSKALNTGVVAFSKAILQVFSNTWTEIYNKRVGRGFVGDQGIFNELAPKMPIQEISTDYNATFHDITPEEELERWDDIRVFHFLHSWPLDKKKFKSYRLSMELGK